MHTTRLGSRWSAVHNGDFSGDVIFVQHHPEKRFPVPFAVVAGLVAEKVRADRMAQLEDASPDDLLYGPKEETNDNRSRGG